MKTVILGNTWSINAPDFSTNMSMTVHVSIDGSNQSSGSIAAFSSTEIRGLEATSSTAPFGDYAGQSIYCLMVHGDSSGDILSFKWSPDGTETNAIPINTSDGSTIYFTVNDNLGTVTNPILFVGTTGNYQSSGSGYQSGSSLTDSNFQTAIDLWFTNEANATATYGHIRDWNASAVTNMYQAFQGRTSFNEDISKWDVSRVVNMERIFDQATSFNQNIGDWNVSSVTNMHDMFKNAFSFNQPIGGWDTSSVTRMSYLFSNSGFNHSISDWNVSSVESLTGMFEGNTALNDTNKGLIHASFSSNSNWPYDWSAFEPNIAPIIGSELSLSIPEGSGAVTIPATWDRTYGGNGWDHFNEMIPTSDGGYLFVGSSDSNVSGKKSQDSRGGKDYWAVKVDASGNQLWDKRFGGSGEDLCKGALATSDGGYLLFGTSDSPANGDRSVWRYGKDYWVVKIDANGIMLWEKTYGSGLDDICYDALELPNGNIILAGTSNSAAWAEKSQNSMGGNDFWLVELNSEGSKVRDKVFGGTGDDRLYSFELTHDGGLLLGGINSSGVNGDISEATYGLTDYWILRLDSSWNKLWDQRYGGDNWEWLSDLADAPDGGFFLAGQSRSSANGDISETVNDPYQGDFWVVKIDQNGTLLWENLLVADSSNYDVSLLVKPDGGLWVIGESWGSVARPNILGYEVTALANGESDALLFELDANGNQLKDRWVGGPNEEWGPSMLGQQNGNGFLVEAKSNSVPGGDRSAIGFGGFDAWVSTFDADGNRNHYASDPDGDVLTWSISGGADATKFSINATTGELTLSSTDYENAQDTNGDNVYEVTLKVTDPGGLSSSKPVTVTVTDVNEPTQPPHTVPSAANLEMIWVEPGTFTMGSPVTEAGRETDEIEHSVTLTKGFYLGKYEVTQAQYEAVMTGNTDGLSATPSNWPNNPNRPVEMVSWNDIQVFLQRLNDQESTNLSPGWAYVLPTEAEWEYACRAGTNTAYSWGEAISASDANWNHGADPNQTVNVGQFSANAWGFHDMHGNLWEWTADWYGNNGSGSQTDPTGPESGINPVRRGGSFVDAGTPLRSAYRTPWTSGDFPGVRFGNIGFRLAYKKTNNPPTDLRLKSANKSVDFTSGTSQSPTTKDGFEEGNPYWDITKDVLSKSGKLLIDHRPGGAWDRVKVFQNNPTTPLFDTGNWTTSSNETDRFVVRYGPDRNTTFQLVPQDTNGNGTFDNKSHYLSHLGVSDDGSSSGWETRINNEYQNLGLVSTNASDPTSTEITVRIIASGTVFEVDLSWEALESNPGTLTLEENQPVGTAVGEFTATDPDANATLTYHLVSGAGDGNNSLFTLETNGTLKTATTFDFESNASTYSIRVQAKDEYNATVEKIFTVNLTDVVESTLYRPLPKALAAQDLGNSKYTFWGIILADGGSPVTGVAFELADNMLFHNSTIHTATMLAGSPNFSVTLELQPDTRYHYRALATNSVGTAHGSPKELTTPPDQTHWWSDAIETAGGWRTSPWFGTFRPYDNGWIYHAKLGWAYAHPDGSGGLWLWLEDHHWMWTQQGVFPYFWKHDLGTWHYLIGLINGRPYFIEWNDSIASKDGGGCCDGLPNSVDTGSAVTHKGVTVSGFEPGGKLCFPNLVAQGMTGMSYVYNFKTASGARGTVTTYRKFSEPRLVYTDPDGKCWESNVDEPGYFKTLMPFEKKDANQVGAKDCCGGLPNTVDTGSGSTLNGVTVRGFDEGGKLCFPNLVGQGKSGITYAYNFRTKAGARGTVTTYQRFSEPRLVYTDPDGKCWEANLDAPGYFKTLSPLP
ncbi:MAG: SUMF1/EgtB/PvdO family nonheme iron enzyme [Opitutales bacterium]